MAREQTRLLLAEVDRLWDEFPQRRAQQKSRVRELRALAQANCTRCQAILDTIDVVI